LKGAIKNMKVKKSELMRLWAAIEKQMENNKHLPVKYGYFLAQNKIKIKDEVNALMEIVKPSQEYSRYDQRRAELAKSMADKDGAGNPIIEGGNYRIVENKEKFEKQLDGLRKEFKSEIEKVEKQLEEYNDILKEEIKFDGYKIRMQDLPPTMDVGSLQTFLEVDLVIAE
jgi:hypothetical protein